MYSASYSGNRYYGYGPRHLVDEFADEDVPVLIQHAILKYENEDELLGVLRTILEEKRIQRTLDMLVGTQKVRRIGPEILQNNTSHTEIPELPAHLVPIVEGL